MLVSEIAKIIDAEIVVKPEDGADPDVPAAFSCDLMSDVLAFMQEGTMLITGLVSPHAIRTCEMLDTQVVVFVRGKQIPDEVKQLAEDRGICILNTKLSMYAASGLLWQNGLSGEALHG